MTYSIPVSCVAKTQWRSPLCCSFSTSWLMQQLCAWPVIVGAWFSKRVGREWRRFGTKQNQWTEESKSGIFRLSPSTLWPSRGNVPIQQTFICHLARLTTAKKPAPNWNLVRMWEPEKRRGLVQFHRQNWSHMWTESTGMELHSTLVVRWKYIQLLVSWSLTFNSPPRWNQQALAAFVHFKIFLRIWICFA